MPVILTTQEEIDLWMTAPAPVAKIGGMAAQRAGTQPFRRSAEKAGHGRGGGGQRGHARLAPGGEGGPVGLVQPRYLGGGSRAWDGSFAQAIPRAVRGRRSAVSLSAYPFPLLSRAATLAT